MARGGYRAPESPAPIPGLVRTCTNCSATKDENHFPLIGSRSPGKRRSICTECKREQSRKAHFESIGKYEEYRAKRNAYKLKRRYGMTVEERDHFIAARGGSCEICGSADNKSHDGALCIDHDHECCPGENTCGECIRGVLCFTCNMAVGYLRNSSANARLLVKYLEVWDAKRRLSSTA